MSASAPLSAWEAILLGIVEGLTEYLPISSTGHLLLVSDWLGRESDPAVNSFVIVIQAGAILAVLGLYHERILQMLRGLAGRDAAGLRLLRNLVVAFLPAVAFGLALEETIKAHLFGRAPIALALAAGGLLMLGFEPRSKRLREEGNAIESLTIGRSLAIGLAQCLALWPGTSRSMVTILGGVSAGLSPAAAAEFSFLLALPTLGGATAYEALSAGEAMLQGVPPLAVALGLATSFVTAAIAVKAFVSWLSNHGMWPFGVYRLLLAALVGATVLVAG